ncbi:CAP domain-containing protein [Candidatus Peregrinibacteria bacterium]|nr:CAP domain-containing protein [Candidatus Peregrinibacteria bacterium]
MPVLRIAIAGVMLGLLARAPFAAAQTPPVTFVHRGEAVMMILKSAGAEIDKNAKTFSAYPDVIDGEWYVPYVVKALSLGMISVEKSTGLVRPHASVTRGEFLKMLTKGFGLTSGIAYTYTDVSGDSPYATYAGLAEKYGLLETGRTPEQLRPDLRVSHAEVTRAIVTLLRAEPQLAPPGGFLPALPTGVLKQQGQTLDSVALSLHRATKEVFSYATLTTPKTVKAAMLKILQSRTNLGDTTRNDIIKRVNEHRAKFKLSPLTSNFYLEKAAQDHAKDMQERGYFSHFSPEGLSYVDRIRTAGYLNAPAGGCECATQFAFAFTADETSPNSLVAGTSSCSCEPDFALGENLAKGQLSVEQVIEDWMNSPRHRENILRPEFAEIGIGLFGDFWVQEFGRVQFR